MQLLSGRPNPDSARRLKPQAQQSGYTRVSTDDDLESAESDEDTAAAHLEQFRSLAEMGELDFYTCVSLSTGVAGCCKSCDVFKRLPVLVALQFIVPICLVVYQMKRLQFVAKDTDVEFRVIGFIVYLYSVWNMHDNSLDECRTVYLELATDNGLPLRFTWAALLGDFINAFAGFALVLTLFTVFCMSIDPFNLVINSLAINYLGNVDNDFCDEALKLQAVKNFELLATGHLAKPGDTPRRSRCRTAFHFVFGALLSLLRGVGTLGLGHILAFVFVAGNLPALCTNYAWMNRTSFCLS